MQTPAGHEMRDGIAYPVDWLAIVFNPSFPYRFAHMFTAAYLTTSLVVLSVGARYLVTQRFIEESKTMIRMGLGMVAILAPLQLVIGDLHGLNTAEYQPVKVAAMEGHWEGSKPAPLLLFAWPDAEAETNHFEIGIPRLGSLIITHDSDGLFKGLKDFKADERPPLLPVFFAFRAMVAIGLLMIAIGGIGAFLWWRRKLFETSWFLRPLTYAWPLGFIAIICGWWVTETGRQPHLVYGILRTVDGASAVAFGAVLTTLILFVLIYTSVFSMGILYINRLIEKGPEGKSIEPEGPPEDSLGSRPLAAAQDAARNALKSGR
jgi:cytochrome d ubiquinol oxidase subunit I